MIDPELRSLLAPPGFDARAVPLRMIRRRGEPVLLVPRCGAKARAALGLYAAQTPRARLWRHWLGVALRIGWPFRDGTVDFAPAAPLGRFLAGIEGADPSPFAIAFGNARAAGRRFLVLLFDRSGAPCAVVKAGANERARDLIGAEADLLAALPAGLPGAPRLRGHLRESGSAAFALDFIPGASPRALDEHAIGPLLTSWLDRAQRVPLGDLPAWQRLAAASSGDPAFAGSQLVHPAVMHGDFAPWNVRVHDGRWMLVDWERGELDGVPGWDWLHYVVQQAVLVQRFDAPRVRERVAHLLTSAAFTRYAQQAGIAGSEELIARGYFRYCASVLRPTERTGTFAALAALTPPPR